MTPDGTGGTCEHSLEAWSRGLQAVAGLYPEASDSHRRDVASFTPIVQARARGPRFTDVEGREWIDWHMGWGAGLLGHADDEVAAALTHQLARGFVSSVAPALAFRVAERLKALIPGAERVVFGKNGSDACTAAVRLARLATGRPMVLAAAGHYHGFHDWTVARDVAGTAVPAAMASSIQLFPAHDPAALEHLLRRHRGQVAAVMLEPVRDTEADASLLGEIACASRRAGALLVFDEMLTGFRCAPGGAQELTGVQADLCCLGKSLANGLPLACVAGSEKLLARVHEARISMTFQHETLALAAAEVVLGRVASGSVVPRIQSAARGLASGLATAAGRHRAAPLHVGGFPGRQCLHFPAATAEESRARLTLFLQEMIVRGVFLVGNLLPSASHGEAEVGETLAAAEGALGVVAEAVEQGAVAARIRFPFAIV